MSKVLENESVLPGTSDPRNVTTFKRLFDLLHLPTVLNRRREPRCRRSSQISTCGIIRLFPFLCVLMPNHAAIAKKAHQSVWEVTKTTDPITGASTCVVAAYDHAEGTSFSRTGSIYPFVETSSAHGLLIGVSSGGQLRMPTGNILWRVDDHPFRSLKAVDNPVDVSLSTIPQNDPATSKLVAQQMRAVAAAMATSTVSSGAKAHEMLAEMLSGSALIFRTEAMVPAYGLPTGAEQRVGQITKNGLRPYPLDDSFRVGLVACGIST